jgi:branched-chain amino acid aminotransferase
MELAKDMGMNVEKRPIKVEELSGFDEVGACGTAAVISPVKKIVDRETGKVYEFCKDGKAGPISTKLYNKLLGIQTGEEKDKFGWNYIVE